MNHFFILGNHPALSAAELFAQLDISRYLLIGQEVFLAQIEKEFDAKELIRNLGGTIKCGRIEKKIPAAQALNAGSELLGAVPKEGKFNFGISIYGKSRIDTRKLGIDMKIALRKTHGSCRFVTSREKTLSSVVVEQNRLVGSGRELVYIGDGGELYIGVTEAVQAFKDLSHRDYGRPARDDRSGMLPPKLAQIMINLAAADRKEVLLDPFCGSGTILTEALLMGYEHIVGSDISPKAVADSKKNIEWIKKEFGVKREIEVSETDARRLSEKFKKDSIGAIITETYLGPQRGQVDIRTVSRELASLYEQTFREIDKVLKKGGIAVIALPAFIEGKRPKLLPIATKPLRAVTVLPLELRDLYGISERGTLLYGRQDQKVWREILILEK